MDFREYDVTREGSDVIVTGTIREPVNWDFTIRITGDDIPGMLRLGLHRYTLAMAAHWLFRRRSRPSATPESAPAAKTEPMVSPRAIRKAPRATGSPQPVQSRADTQEPEVDEPEAEKLETEKLETEELEAEELETEELETEELDEIAAAADDAAPQHPAEERAPARTATADFGTPRRRGEPAGGPMVATDSVTGGAAT